MSADEERGVLGDVVAPEPPEGFTVLEVQNLQKLVREQLRRAERRFERDKAAGGPKNLPGADANVVRMQVYGPMDEKLEAWLQECWPLVDEAKIHAGLGATLTAQGEGETVGEAQWNAMRALEMRANGRFDPKRVEVVVISEGVRGMLGVGQEPAKVMVKLTGGG